MCKIVSKTGQECKIKAVRCVALIMANRGVTGIETWLNEASPIGEGSDVKLELANESTNTKVKVFVWEKSALKPYTALIPLN